MARFSGLVYRIVGQIFSDFNSKSPEWGSSREDAMGKLLGDLAASLGLAVCNRGRKPTFVWSTSESHLGLIFVTQSAAGRVCGWAVLDEELLSLHKYIMYEINTTKTKLPVLTRKGWAIRKLDYAKLAEALKCSFPTEATTVEEDYSQMMSWLSGLCDSCMLKAHYSGYRQPTP